MKYKYKICINKKQKTMKQKILNQIKKLQQNQMILVTLFMIGLFAVFIPLSIHSNGLFLKEILLCSLIVGLVLMNQKDKN